MKLQPNIFGEPILNNILDNLYNPKKSKYIYDYYFL